MKKIIILLISLIITTFGLVAQQVSTNTVKLVINHEMIKRFNDLKTEGDFYSWRQLFSTESAQRVTDFLLAYRTSNLNETSLQDIELALEEKAGNTDSLRSLVSDEEYIANLNRIKMEIKTKLGSSGQVAMK